MFQISGYRPNHNVFGYIGIIVQNTPFFRSKLFIAKKHAFCSARWIRVFLRRKKRLNVNILKARTEVEKAGMKITTTLAISSQQRESSADKEYLHKIDRFS